MTSSLNGGHRGGLAVAALVSLAATVPIALTDAGKASAGALVVAPARVSVLDALRTPMLLSVRAADPSGEDARYAIDGRDDTAWSGRAGESAWKWSAVFVEPVHLGLLRAHFGRSPTSGVPTSFRWQARAPLEDGKTCESLPPTSDDGWTTIEDTEQVAGPADYAAQPTHRSWFVDVDACGLRLVVDRANAGPPVVREVQAIESARDVLRSGEASDDGAWSGFAADDAIDGTYARRWVGAPGKGRWTLRVDLREPAAIDRVRLVLGFDATSVARKSEPGRAYVVAWAPVHYVVEASDDGKRFVPIASEPVRSDGSPLPLRRRLVTLSAPRTIRALRVVMTGATGASGLPDAAAAPVVRELAAYGADDKRPVLAPPWLLAVNANPSPESKNGPGGELANDVYYAKFLQLRFAQALPPLRRDDRYTRALGSRGELLVAPPGDSAGQALESIEGDDAQLDAQLLSESSPPPIAILSGSNNWDYAPETGPDAQNPKRWRWDPLRDARGGGLGQLATVVKQRTAPLMGFCGGAQILALLEAKGSEDDRATIDRVLRRTNGRPIRGFAPLGDVEVAWPGDSHPRAHIEFLPGDPLFADVAGPMLRATTQALPESHADVVRPDAFLPGGPLQRFEVLATSAFCAPDVVPASPRDGVFRNPGGAGWCDTVPEAFRSRDPAWPIIGAQFHAEQRDFAQPGPGDPPESTADARLFLVAAFEQMVDAYVKLAP